MVEIPQRDLAEACNRAAAVASRQFLFLMNSDCTFDPGALATLLPHLDDEAVARCRVRFTAASWFATGAARYRDYLYNTLQRAYQPGLVISQSTIRRVGYLFHPGIRWNEDAELSRRLSAARIPTMYVGSVSIEHAPLAFAEDVRSAFRYGVGRRWTDANGLTGGSALRSLVKNWMQATEAASRLGAGPLAYILFAWLPAWTLGYWIEVARLAIGRRPRRINESTRS